MFTTSNDVLNLVLALCLIALTFFLCWAIYYFIVSVQKFYRIVRRAEEGVTKAEEILDLAKDKLKSSGMYVSVLAEVAKKAMNFVQEKKDKKAAAKKK
jgi:hypothetical protein